MGEVIYFRHRVRYQPSDTPFSQMNITPLIDVMLVLLVMLILAVPVAMHQTSVNLPPPGPITTTKPPTIQNLVVTSDGVAHWNGAIVDDAALQAKLRTLAIAGDTLRIETDGYARYERFNQLIAMVNEAGVENLGFVGNSRYKQWSKPSNS
ncbi:biopolymer transporter ExbD [Sphingorhabdus pulchriflava]|uniref:Biopolymer transporter ExbD n=1 Tax=Sphingorhabdus pulchriflava TaxID=2292257 RepID=A0A371BF53_9SPHN|nr:biopolymer transporter ExbD [Sphingorhabdus pulchriflava]RDV06138.1 biopolymer transporter ExbD [Sphingorhabdus pulchriflava]